MVSVTTGASASVASTARPLAVAAGPSVSPRRSKRLRDGLWRGLCFSAWLAQGFCMELLRVAYCRAFDSRQLRQCEIDKAFFFHHRYDLSWSWCLKEFAQMFPCQLSQNRANKKPGWNMPAFQRAMVHQHSEPSRVTPRESDKR